MSSASRVAFVTYAGIPGLTDDDRLAAAALDRIGVRVDAVRWDDPRAEWMAYAAVVLRSTWDYHHRLGEFRSWIDRLDALGARLWNPPDVLRWNTDKRYLERLTHPHLSPPPAVILDQGSRVALGALLEQHGWDEVVIKPTVSADAFSTGQSSRERATADQPGLDAMLASGDVMLQALVPEIRTNGELSLMFLGGRFSHAVRKQPRRGEFRVQERLGGTITPAVPPADLIRHARDLLARHAPGCLYARVDVVSTPDRFVLMEIELVEPSLFLAHHAPAAAAFANAIRGVFPIWPASFP